MKKMILAFMLTVITLLAYAQPSESEITEILKEEIAGVISVDVVKEINADIDVKNSSEYIFEVKILRNSKIVSLKETIEGNAVFVTQKDGTYKYVKLNHKVNSFETIPQITIEDIKKVIGENHPKYFGEELDKIVNLINHPSFTDDLYIYWHSLNVVEVHTKYRVQRIINNKETELCDKVALVSLFRNDKTKDWHNFEVKPVNHTENKVFEKQEFSEDQITLLKNRTLDKNHYWLEY